MVSLRRHATLIACGFCFALAGVSPAQAASPGDSTSVADLPITEFPAAGSSGTLLAVILSGDGGWVGADKQMAVALTRRGIPVVGLNSPSYLSDRRSPDGAAGDLRRLLTHYLLAWHRQQVVLIGYSHGAGIAPFMVSRLPDDLRHRIALLTLVGLSSHTSFQFHVADVVADISRSDDLMVRPELEKLRGTPILCIVGEHERDSLCPTLDSSLAQVETHAGGHRLPGREGSAVVDQIFAAKMRPL